MCAGATLCVECDTCGFCHVEPPLYRLANGYSSAADKCDTRSHALSSPSMGGST